MNDNDSAERMAQLLRVMQRQKDMIPPGLRDTIATIDRLTAPLKALQRGMPLLLPAPAVPTLAAPHDGHGQVREAPGATTADQTRPAPEPPAAAAPPPEPDAPTADASRLAGELIAVAEAIEAGADLTPMPPKAQAAFARGIAELLGRPTRPAAPHAPLASLAQRQKGALPTSGAMAVPDAVPIVNMRAGLPYKSPWTPAQEDALLCQEEGCPGLRKNAISTLAEAWGISPSNVRHHLSEARKRRQAEAR